MRSAQWAATPPPKFWAMFGPPRAHLTLDIRSSQCGDNKVRATKGAVPRAPSCRLSSALSCHRTPLGDSRSSQRYATTTDRETARVSYRALVSDTWIPSPASDGFVRAPMRRQRTFDRACRDALISRYPRTRLARLSAAIDVLADRLRPDREWYDRSPRRYGPDRLIHRPDHYATDGVAPPRRPCRG